MQAKMPKRALFGVEKSPHQVIGRSFILVLLGGTAQRSPVDLTPKSPRFWELASRTQVDTSAGSNCLGTWTTPTESDARLNHSPTISKILSGEAFFPYKNSIFLPVWDLPSARDAQWNIPFFSSKSIVSVSMHASQRHCSLKYEKDVCGHPRFMPTI